MECNASDDCNRDVLTIRIACWIASTTFHGEFLLADFDTGLQFGLILRFN